MTNKKYKSISISNLIINPDNDRFESVENEKQAIDIMLTKLGDKIYYIAIHILENGLSPKPFYVMPSKKSNKKFLVKEGNRRTTALKLMANPKLIDSKKHASLKNRFFKLHERFMETPIRKIMCYIYDDVEEADKWVRLEHTGEQNGVGIVEWKPEQVQRFDIKHGKNKSVEIQAIDFIRTSPFVQEEVKRASENIKLTNFARYNSDDLKKRIKLIALYKDKIELHNLDAVELIHNLQSNLPNNSLFYFDPPYYKKGKGLYMNYYDDQDHRDIYNAIAGLENIKWVVTYDKEDFILDLYLKFRMYEYSLNYSAATVGKGQEYMIFSDNCIVPEKSSINFNKVITI